MKTHRLTLFSITNGPFQDQHTFWKIVAFSAEFNLLWKWVKQINLCSIDLTFYLFGTCITPSLCNMKLLLFHNMYKHTKQLSHSHWYINYFILSWDDTCKIRASCIGDLFVRFSMQQKLYFEVNFSSLISNLAHVHFSVIKKYIFFGYLVWWGARRRELKMKTPRLSLFNFTNGCFQDQHTFWKILPFRISFYHWS